jgi:hypothetical protein
MTNTTTKQTVAMVNASTRTEWVAVLHGQNGTVKMAFRNPRAMAFGLEAQTKEGWMVASVYQRQAQIYTEDE